MSALEEEARQKASENQESAKAKTEQTQAPAKQLFPAEPPDKAQRNFTDPDSRIMKTTSTKSFEQCYNAQAMVDDLSQVILAANLSQHANDSDEVEPILDILKKTLAEFRTGWQLQPMPDTLAKPT